MILLKKMGDDNAEDFIRLMNLAITAASETASRKPADR
jgi:hypothetical protein